MVARILQVVCLLGSATPVWGGSPCDTVSRDLPSERKAVLAPEIAKQLNVKSVDVLQSFKLGSWQIIYVNTHESDEPFLFYSGDPLKTRYVTMWSGAARMSCTTFKIRDSVILFFFTLFVIDLRQIVRIRNESNCDQTMHKSGGVSGVNVT